MIAEWKTPEAMEFIRQSRAAGVGFNSISAELGVSPNAVIGASHRANHPRERRADLHAPWTKAEVAILSANSTLLMPKLMQMLPGRTKHSIQRKRTSLKVEGPQLGANGRWPERPVPRLAPLASLVDAHVPPRRLPPVEIPTQQAPISHPSAPMRRAEGCQWITGDTRHRGWRFCNESSEPGKPYCSDHAKLAYVRVHDRREDTDA